MKSRWMWLVAAVAFLVCTAFGQNTIPDTIPTGTIPAGTILPVALRSTITSAKAKLGETFSARVMQDVPLPNGMKIRKGTKIIGRVVAAQPAAHGRSGRLSLAFNRLLTSTGGIAVTTNLRALASPTEVEAAHIPAMGMGCGDTSHAWTTTQVGGDVVYWGGGPVASDHGPVGVPVTGTDGVLAKVTAKPDSPCAADVGVDQAPQALWVFSSDACGVYGLDGVTIAHAGRTAPLGVIELSSSARDVKLPDGTAMLLRVIGRSE